MYTVVSVKKVNNDGTVLVGCSTNACQGCKAELFCNTKDHTEYLALNPSDIQIKEGDFVELYLPPGKTILSTVLVFALPLALFPIGYVLSGSVFGFVNEIHKALVGIGFMSLAFVISAIVSIRNKKRLMPSITKVVG